MNNLWFSATPPAWSRVLSLTVLLLLAAGCNHQPSGPDTHESLNATLWSQTAAEYVASTTQAYQLAAANLDLALADGEWTAVLAQQGDYSNLPPAVLIDIDQTVLDNSRYNARIIMEYGEHSQEAFRAWCEESAASAIPGAKKFIDHAVESGVTVIYVSRRQEKLRACTTKNLKALGFPVPEPQYLLLNNKQPSTRKAYLRKELSSRFRILLLIGDDLEDFVAGSKTDAAARRALSMKHADRWGRQWIILPNSMYGAWETSLYEFNYSMPRDKRLNLKSRQLEE
ncbi:MAG: hypothetical protein DRR42_09960 [Gammaproteobacteria bacterium]|nr:MAG: hypothetical protein DRR42_09960 [Gammaproteobacteria bacterium]